MTSILSLYLSIHNTPTPNSRDLEKVSKQEFQKIEDKLRAVRASIAKKEAGIAISEDQFYKVFHTPQLQQPGRNMLGTH